MNTRLGPILGFSLILLLLGVAYLTVSNTAMRGGEADTPAQSLARRDSAAGITVQVSPVSLGVDGAPSVFEIALDTHSVNLDDDLVAAAALRCDRGDEHSALEWMGAAPGGHHRAGSLRFAPFDHPVTSVELVLRGVGGVPERAFLWDIPA